ncbi:MAG TPA: DUF1569 domain-containing protein [Geothrix sp.]|uniref:DUF1569 domain-containing protein n=1 Tax=Geothrix mesophila TaxID=2922723 RepID=UPI001FADB53C|nr:DUF1569 domain-containing protein [Geothrix sp. SG198]HJV37312.1 DUF1569 domain-containing protein [Geothrix sp.]
MNSLFNPVDRDALARRFAELEPGAQRQWGKMDPAQMMKHCALALGDPLGDRQVKQLFLGKLITPFIRGQVFGEKPFRRNSPTDPIYVVSSPQDFETERTRLATLIDRVVQRGAAKTEGRIHPFFGRLSGDQWGRLIYKHFDHHLRQFGV